MTPCSIQYGLFTHDDHDKVKEMKLGPTPKPEVEEVFEEVELEFTSPTTPKEYDSPDEELPRELLYVPESPKMEVYMAEVDSGTEELAKMDQLALDPLDLGPSSLSAFSESLSRYNKRFIF